MTKINTGSPQNNIFVYDASSSLDEAGCIRLFIMKDQTAAWEHAFSLKEARDLIDALQIAIAEHCAKYGQESCSKNFS